MAEDIPKGKGNLQQGIVPLHNPLKKNNLEPSLLLLIVRTVITIPVVVIWLFMGLYIWIPLVIRRLGSYISAVISSAITRNTDNVVAAGINLEHGISFFFDGFKLIFHSLGYSGWHLDEQEVKASIRAKEEFLMSTLTWCIGFAFFLIMYLV